MFKTRSTMSRDSRPTRLRGMLYASLAAGLLAGTVCTGTGTGTAAPATSANTVTSISASADAPQSDLSYWWYLNNQTDQPVWGTWTDEEHGATSVVSFSKEHPLEVDGTGKAHQSQQFGYKSYYSAKYCYNHTFRGLPRTPINSTDFTLIAEWTGQLMVRYREYQAYSDTFIALGDTGESC